jgi:hypothetical protein
VAKAEVDTRAALSGGSDEVISASNETFEGEFAL